MTKHSSVQPMTLTTGDRIGPYEIVGWVGAGGMGEVYHARDPRLGRAVAIKLIPPRMATDANRIHRFEQEARAAGQLNHPNVLSVYDVGTHAGGPYIVSELLEGESLGSRLGSGRLSLSKAVEYTRQVAEGLAAAHDKQIVHRDVKPENVFITSDERIKILDFGIAKLTGAGSSADQPHGGTETDPGTVMGSARYMSPEQVRGEAVDARSDLFSLGSVLYEMLAGQPAFARPTSAETMAAILNEEPPVLRDVPPSVARIVFRCLEKTREARFRSARDLAFALDLLAKSESTEARVSRARLRQTMIPTLAVVGVTVALLTWQSRRLAPAPPAETASVQDRLTRATLTPLTDWEGVEAQAAVSPDGRFVAFLSDRDDQFDIWLSQVGTKESTNLTRNLPAMNPPGVVLRPFGFTGDGSKIWFSLTGNPGDPKSLMSLLGGTPWAFLGDGDVTPSWSPDAARVAFVNNRNGDPMFVADGVGADARQILASESGVLHNHDPVWSPDGEWIYFVRGSEPIDEMDIWRVRSAGGVPERLTTLGIPVNFLAPLDARTLLYVSRAEDRSGPWLWALDVTTKVSRRVSWGLEQYTSISASRDGRHLVATVARQSSSVWTVPILDRIADDRDAQRLPLQTVGALAPRFSGSALFYQSALGRSGGLWRLVDGASVEVWRGADGVLSEPPAFSPDGRRMALVMSRQSTRQLTVVSIDGTGARTVSAPLEMQGAAGQSTIDWLDSDVLVTGGADKQGPGLFTVPVSGGPAKRLHAGQSTNPAISPDGKIVLFTGPFVGGRAPLLAIRPDGTPLPLPAITVRQGAYRFLRDGRRVVYIPALQSRDFWLLDLFTGARRQLTRFTDRQQLETFDISPDGKRIVFDRRRENSDIVLIDLPDSP